MSLRVAAALSLALGVSMLFTFFYWIGESPFSAGAERHLREMKERTTAPDTIVPYTFAGFTALPHGRPVAEFATLERRGVSLEGYVNYMHLSSDGDFHLNVCPSRTGTGLTVTAELTPQWQRASRWWQWEPLVTALRPHAWPPGEWPREPRRMRVSGWLMYDFQYDEPFVKTHRPHLPGPAQQRLTGWEIHPITRLELWDDDRQAFVEYPR